MNVTLDTVYCWTYISYLEDSSVNVTRWKNKVPVITHEIILITETTMISIITHLYSFFESTHLLILLMNCRCANAAHICKEILHVKVVYFHPLYHILNISLTCPVIYKFEEYCWWVWCPLKNWSTEHLQKKITSFHQTIKITLRWSFISTIFWPYWSLNTYFWHESTHNGELHLFQIWWWS